MQLPNALPVLQSFAYELPDGLARYKFMGTRWTGSRDMDENITMFSPSLPELLLQYYLRWSQTHIASFETLVHEPFHMAIPLARPGDRPLMAR